MGEKNTIALLTSINGYLKIIVDSNKQNSSPEDKDTTKTKSNEKKVKDLSSGGLGSILSESSESKSDSNRKGLRISEIVEGLDSLQRLPFIVKKFAKIKDNDINKLRQCLFTLSIILKKLSDNTLEIEQGVKSLARIASAIEIIGKMRILKLGYNLLLFKKFKIDKLLREFISGTFKAISSAPKVDNSNVNNIKTAVSAMNSMNSLAKGCLIAIGSIVALALAIKFVGQKEIITAAGVTLVIMSTMGLIVKSIALAASSAKNAIGDVNKIIAIVAKFQVLILSTIVVGVMVKKYGGQIITGIIGTCAVILGYTAIIALAEHVNNLYAKKRKEITSGVFKVVAMSISLVLATVLLAVVVKHAWKDVLYGFGGIIGMLAIYLGIIGIASVIGQKVSSGIKHFSKIILIVGASLGLVLATVLIGAVIKEAEWLIAIAIVGIVGLMWSYGKIATYANTIAKFTIGAKSSILKICAIIAASGLLVLGVVAIASTIKREGLDWEDLSKPVIGIGAILSAAGGILFAIKKITQHTNVAAIGKGVIVVGAITLLIGACEGILYSALLLGKKVKEDKDALLVGAGALGASGILLTILCGIGLIIAKLSPIKAVIDVLAPTVAKVIALVYMCEGLILGAYYIGNIISKDPDGALYGAAALVIAGVMVKGVISLAKILGKVNSDDVKKQAVFKELLLLAYGAIGLVAAAIIIGKMIKKDPDILIYAAGVLIAAASVITCLIGLMNMAAMNSKTIQKGINDIKFILLAAAGAEALIMGAVLIAKYVKSNDIDMWNVAAIIGGALGIVGAMILLCLAAAWGDAALSKTPAKGLKGGAIILYMVVGVAAAAELLLFGLMALAKYRKDNSIAGTELANLLCGCVGIIAAIGLVCAAAAAVAIPITIGAVALIPVIGVAISIGLLMKQLINLSSSVKELGGDNTDAGLVMIDKSLAKMKTVINIMSEVCETAALNFLPLTGGAIAIKAVSSAANAISKALTSIASSAKIITSNNISDKNISKMLKSFDKATTSIYDLVGVKFAFKAGVILLNMPAISTVTAAASMISTAMSRMASVVNDEGKMRSMTVTDKGEVIYGEWGDPVKAADVIATSMSIFSNTLFNTFKDMTKDSLKIIGVKAISNLISPVSSFVKALMSFQEAGDGKIREIKFDDEGNQIDTPTVDVAAVATSIGNAVSLFCNTLFSEENISMWERISAGTGSRTIKNAAGKEITVSSEGGVKAAMGVLSIIIDPICNFAKTLTTFEDSDGTSLIIPIYDNNGKLINRRKIQAVNIAIKISEAINNFVDTFAKGSLKWQELYKGGHVNGAVKSESHTWWSDEAEYGDPTNTFAESMGVFASVITPIVSFTNLLASFGQTKDGELITYDKDGKPRKLNLNVIASSIGNAIQSFIEILIRPFKTKENGIGFELLSKSGDMLKTTFTEFGNAIKELGDINSDNVANFYTSFDNILKAILDFGGTDNSGASQNAINIITSLSTSIAELCKSDTLSKLRQLNDELQKFSNTVGSKIVDAITNLGDIANDKNGIIDQLQTTVDKMVDPKAGVITVYNKVNTSINETRVAISNLDSVLRKGSNARVKEFDAMTNAVKRLYDMSSGAKNELVAMSQALEAINKICENASNNNVQNAIDAIGKIGHKLSGNSSSSSSISSAPGWSILSTTPAQHDVQTPEIANNKQTDSYNVYYKAFVDALAVVFDGATFQIRGNGEHSNNAYKDSVMIGQFDVNRPNGSDVNINY